MQMMVKCLTKSPEVRVFRRRHGDGIVLLKPSTNDSLTLDHEDAQAWLQWRPKGDLMERLLSLGMAIPAPESNPPFFEIDADQSTFRIVGNRVRWYAESEDLTIMMNTRSMRQNNPLIVLNSYGSLVWNDILQGKRVVDIRRHAIEVFGADEVEPLLLRLRDLEFITSDDNPVLHPWNDERIEKEFLAPELQFELIQSKIPWYTLWELCRSCNLRCEICYQQDFDHRGPTQDEAASIAKSMVDAGLLYVGLLGGEPLVRKDLVSIVKTLRDGGVFTKIITNGILLTKELSRQLYEADLNLIEVSFDGIRAETHDASRGQGNFAKSVQGIRNAWEAGIPRVGVVCTLHSGNIPDFDRLPEFLNDLGVHECYLSLFKKTGQQGSQAPWSPPTPEDQDCIRNLIARWRTEHPHLNVVLLPGCSCGRTSAVIGADSTLRLCSFQYVPKGNILESSLLGVWSDMEAALPESGPLGFCKVIKPCKH